MLVLKNKESYPHRNRKMKRLTWQSELVSTTTGYPIGNEYFSIGLDNWKRVVYTKGMAAYIFTKERKRTVKLSTNQDKKDLIQFVAKQFKQLSQKNLRIPVRLYHL